MTVKTLEKRIDAIAKTGAALQAEIHAVAIECLKHAYADGDKTKGGDVTLTERLFKALPKAIDRSAFLTWLYAFSPIRTNGDQSKWGMVKETAKGYAPFDIEGADAKPFYEFTKKPTPNQLTFEQIVQMVARLEKRLDKIAKGEETDVAPDLDLKAVAALRDKLAKVVAPVIAN